MGDITSFDSPIRGTFSDWRKLAKIAILPPMPLCIVSFVDLRGIRHAVEVQADSLYEAVVLGVSALRELECEPGEISPIDVEVRKSVTHTITLRKVTEWLNGGARSPKEAITKERLRALL